MKNQTRKVIAFLLIFTVIAANAHNPHPLKNGSAWIPADFDVRKSTLLISDFGTSELDIKITHDLEDNMRQIKYPYKFKFVPQSDIDDLTKYANKDQYRYALVRNDTEGMGYDGTRVLRNEYYIYDRKLDKRYPGTGNHDVSLAKSIKVTVLTIMEHLNGLK